MKKINKILILVIIGIFIIFEYSVFFIYTFKDIEAPAFRFLGVNATSCFYNISKVPDKYYNGLRVMTFIKPYVEITPVWYRRVKDTIQGMYFAYSRKIVVYDGCTLDTIIHELAHHKDRIDNGLHIDLKHGARFQNAYNEILNATLENER